MFWAGITGKQLVGPFKVNEESWLRTEWVGASDLLSSTQKKLNDDSDYPEMRVPAQNSAETSQGEGSAVWDMYSDFPPSERTITFPGQKDNGSVKPVHYQSEDIQRDELEPDTLVTFNRGALIGLLVVAVAVAMVIIISLLVIRRKPYGTISHGIIEVEASRTPEDKHLSKMQNQGYENPTYRYLEENN
ncbi:unnamed protein product [Ranitomeya imitator]|uniref:Beta-amyloid precursor protein C-terminal domain-containing protein n=1 Tax=Ranitomeya imitator TaxID=111125 RepID=A0ABN9MG47_9NEOB|nr:unnamed protein product [Ranitomeya imitator]